MHKIKSEEVEKVLLKGRACLQGIENKHSSLIDPTNHVKTKTSVRSMTQTRMPRQVASPEGGPGAKSDSTGTWRDEETLVCFRFLFRSFPVLGLGESSWRV